MAYDNVCKYLAENYPAEIVKSLLGIETEEIEVLKTELSLEPVQADSLIFLKKENQLLHIEFQTRPYSEPPIPLRMLDYYVRLKKQYRKQGVEIKQVVIFLKSTNSPEVLINQFVDTNTNHSYQVIRIWEQDPTPLLKNPALLAFATLAQSDSPRELLEQVAQTIARIEEPEYKRNLSSCVQILAGLRFDQDVIRQLFTGEAMRESVIYQEILQQGVKQGREQGMLQGLEQGLFQGQQKQAVLMVMRLLTRRFGLLEPKLTERIQKLSLPQLEVLGEIFLDFSALTDLITWLDEQAPEQSLLQERQKQAALMVIKWLTRRFGLLEPKLTERVQKLSLSQLEVMWEISLDFADLTDLITWLDEQERQNLSG